MNASNGIKCPSCGHVNILGEDRCIQCLHSLMQRDLPRPKKDDSIQKIMMTAPVSDLLTGEDLLVASGTDSIQKVIKVLQKEKKHCFLVYNKKKLIGILSKRDILLKVAGKHQDLSTIKVEDVMTRNPEYVLPHTPIAYAVNKMALGGFRHVPVLDEDGRPLSIILIQDVLEYLSKFNEK